MTGGFPAQMDSVSISWRHHTFNDVWIQWLNFMEMFLAFEQSPPCLWCHWWTTIKLNTLRPRQNGRRFAEDNFKRIFLNENVRISITISLKFVPKGRINNSPTLVQIMAWRRSGDKPLSEPMIVSLLTHICVTRPHWVKHELLSEHGKRISNIKMKFDKT